MKKRLGNMVRSFLKMTGYTLVSLKQEPLISSFPMGDFYSPILSKKQILKYEKTLFNSDIKVLPGIELNEADQLKLLEDLIQYDADADFPAQQTAGKRYYSPNGPFDYTDAASLQMMMRHFKPKRIIEVGSGFSSAVMMDTNEKYFNHEIKCTFIDPDPSRLLARMNEQDKQKHHVLATQVQDIDLDLLHELDENDIFFIDSSHVSKTGSDVNFIYFEMLPRLKKGVIVHVHDIFYPFEYLPEWIMEGWGWNEAYLLRAFLQFNSKFKILLFNSFLEKHHGPWLRTHLPSLMKSKSHSIWLKRSSS